MAENKDKKVLNVPNKRELTPNELGSAEHKEVRLKRNVPNLRFKEFEGEWKEKRLGNICTFYSGGTPTSSNNKYYGGNIPFIRSGELHKAKTELMITEEGYNNSSAKMVEKGDLLLAMYGATSGDIAISRIKGAINQAILCIKTNHNKKFLETIWSKHVNRILKTYLQGGQGNLSADVVKQITFSIPTIQEQEKLAQLFFILDERITTQNKIIEELKQLKNGIINHTFNSLKTKCTPFKNLYKDAGEGGTPSTSNASYYDNGTIPFIKIDDLKKKYLTCNKDYITNLGLQKSSAWLIPTNSILFSNGATIGEISITTYSVTTKQGILGIVPNSDVDTEYLYYLMSSQFFKKAINHIITEGTMKTAYLKDINKIICPLPSKEVQKNIARLPSILNRKIEIEQSLLDKFLTQKQHLLRQMFI